MGCSGDEEQGHYNTGAGRREAGGRGRRSGRCTRSATMKGQTRYEGDGCKGRSVVIHGPAACAAGCVSSGVHTERQHQHYQGLCHTAEHPLLSWIAQTLMLILMLPRRQRGRLV
jgi:hypothetical protein